MTNDQLKTEIKKWFSLMRLQFAGREDNPRRWMASDLATDLAPVIAQHYRCLITSALLEIEQAAAAADKRGHYSADPSEHGNGHREAIHILLKHLGVEL